ncbi:Dimethyl sulfoxide/trimethylamine N-oxide reductase [Rhodoplanes serenus]|uniref:Dimethyl sulfoxide/trimethylamine N-oxide reductase n=1 Tax=Rhodoplanes serenus TaxID=200615 RepID=A0A3S4B168_9BRAD|nr:molybdopterin-dependent oxidoreductase [Rhodoplanes serenus]VCU09139.1 Dimethyl sulfoxide/trimethylamine N-oxide reductase [Rhodoplanes serenus]
MTITAQATRPRRPVARVPSLAHWGAFTAVVTDGRVVRCEPFGHDPTPSPMLAAIPAMVHSPLRIARPAVREGWREGRPRTGHDTFREVSWDEALDLVAGEVSRVRAAHGAGGIFGGSYGWSSAGRVHHARTLVRRFLALGGGFVDQLANYSFGAAQFLLPHVLGTFQPVTGRATDWPSVVADTRLLIAFGGLAPKNSQVGSGGVGSHDFETWLRRARAAGIRIVNVSPLKSDAPDWLDAEWIAIRPNTDVALMLGLAHTLLTEGRHDAAFLDRYCAGFETFADYLTGRRDGTPKSADWAEHICGVPADTIRALARDAAAQPTYLTATWSLQRAHHGEQPYWALITLAAMLGGIGLPGQGFGFGHGSIHGTGLPRAALPGPDLSPPPNPAGLAIPVARIADMLLDPGGTYEFNGRRLAYPDVRMVYWAGGNPFHHHQDLNRLRRAWQKPETVVVHDSWWTPTARHADIVLPATTSLERNDVGGTSRDRFLFAMHRAIAPVGEARHDIDIFAALAGRLGYADAFTEGRDEMAWCRLVYDRIRDGAAAKGVALPAFQQFWAEGFVALPPPERDFVLFEEFRRDPDVHRLATPSGKIEIVSAAVAGFGYDDAPPHPAWLPPAEWLGSPAAKRFPLHLITNQPARRLHSQTDPGPVSVAGKISEREPIRLNPQDAARRGLSDGDIVRVFNDRGACLAGLVIDPDVAPGVAVMATGAWFDPLPEGGGLDVHGNPNVLTPDIGTSRLAQGSSAQSTLVEIEGFVGTPPPVRAFAPPPLAPLAPTAFVRTDAPM